jgi:ABC-type sugar transport system substrate-binding protein
MKRRSFLALIPAALLLAACGKDKDAATPAPALPGGTAAPKTALKIGYVLHGQNDFTQVIKRGAEDAGKALTVDVEVTGPSTFESQEAIGMFEGMVQKKKDGLVVVPMHGPNWIVPIKKATDAGFPVMTANMMSHDSSASAWVGQDEYQSGVILAGEIRKALEAQGKKDGKIVVGICALGDEALDLRYAGFKKGMEGTKYIVTEPHEVFTENTKNYSEWESLLGANKDTVAMVGLCSMDNPNLAKLKVRSGGKWIVGGYDLNIETLDAIKAGTIDVTLGQHPYLQGYLPVLALVQSKRDGKPLPKGWINVGTEIVTKANVDELYKRESDPATETKWYADYIAKNFSDLNAIAKPMPTAKK